MRTRRSLLGAGGLAGVAVLAGCIDLDDLLGDALDAEAEPAGIDPAVVADEGFQHVETEEFGIDEEFDLGDETIELSASNWVAVYAPEDLDDVDFDEDADPDDFDHLDESDVVGAIVISTPSSEVAGIEANPVDHFDEDELIEQFDDAFVDGGVDRIEAVDSRDAEVLGEATELTVYEADVRPMADEEAMPVDLYVTTVPSADDFIITVGLHHRSVDATDSVITLLEATEHPVEAP